MTYKVLLKQKEPTSYGGIQRVAMNCMLFLNRSDVCD